MLLSEIDLAKRLARQDDRRIIIEPIIDARHQFGPSSFDVRIGTHFALLETANLSHIDTFRSGGDLRRDIQDYTKHVNIKAGAPFHLHPGEFVLAATLEFVRLPDDVAGRIEGRSSWGRVGLLVHATAGFIDPGFSGTLTFELSNAGRVPITLKPGLRIGQICFIQMKSPSLIPYSHKEHSKYTGATGVQLSRIYRDPEIALQAAENKKQINKV